MPDKFYRIDPRSCFVFQVKSGDLAEVVRHRDQILRKNESEIDSLNFRNQQLAKRVEILQVRARRNLKLKLNFHFLRAHYTGGCRQR